MDPVSYGLIRNVKPYNINDYEFISNSQKNTKLASKIIRASSGSVSGIDLIDGGSEYRVGDALLFDNERTDGFGAIGSVRKIYGPQLNNITTTVQRLPDTTFIYSPGQITGITTVPHGFLTGTDVNIRNVSGTEHDVIQGMHLSLIHI